MKNFISFLIETFSGFGFEAARIFGLPFEAAGFVVGVIFALLLFAWAVWASMLLAYWVLMYFILPIRRSALEKGVKPYIPMPDGNLWHKFLNFVMFLVMPFIYALFGAFGLWNFSRLILTVVYLVFFFASSVIRRFIGFMKDDFLSRLVENTFKAEYESLNGDLARALMERDNKLNKAISRLVKDMEKARESSEAEKYKVVRAIVDAAALGENAQSVLNKIRSINGVKGALNQDYNYASEKGKRQQALAVYKKNPIRALMPAERVGDVIESDNDDEN